MAAEPDIQYSSERTEDELADALTFLLIPRDSSIKVSGDRRSVGLSDRFLQFTCIFSIGWVGQRLLQKKCELVSG